MNNYYMNEITRILEVAEQQQGSDIFLSLKMIMFDTEVNLNGCQYTKEFLAEIAENQDGKYTCLPLVADINMLTTGQYKKLTHLQDKKTGDFKTTQIGSFYKFELNETDDGVTQLIGYARVPKRHRKVVSALLTLHKEGKLKFSYEIAVANYTVKDNVKHIDVDEHNFIIGLAVVSMPACVNSTSLLAASLDDNLDEVYKGEDMEDKCVTLTEMFAKCANYLTAEIDKEQIRTKIYNALPSFLVGKIDNCGVSGDGLYRCDIRYQFDTFVVLYDYKLGNYYKVAFAVENNEVNLISCDKVALEFVVAEVEKFNKEANQVTIEELKARVAELESMLAEKDTALADKDSQIVTVGEQLATLQAEVETLQPYKAQVEAIEAQKAEEVKVAKCKELKDKAAKVLDEAELAELAEAIETLDEATVNAKIAAKYVSLAEAAKNEKDNGLFVGHRMTDSNKLDDEGSIFERE